MPLKLLSGNGPQFNYVSSTVPVPVSIVSALLPAGTAAAPSISFASDTNTGFYSYGADSIGVAMGGASYWIFHSNGRFYGSNGNGYLEGSGGAWTLAAEGTNKSVTLTPSGTAPVIIGNATKVETDTLSGAGSVSVTKDTTKLTSTGAAQPITLADGVDGQIKRIIHDVDGGSMVLTPSTKTGYTTITFTNAGDAVTLEFITTRGWCITGIYGAVAA